MAAKLTTDEILSVSRGFIELGVQYAEEELDPHRERATRYFEGKTPDGLLDLPNRSTYVDNLLQDTVLWMSPSLSRIFSSADDVVEIRPRDPIHALQAEATMVWVNQVLSVFNSSFIQDQQTIQDALLRRLGWQRFHWDGDILRFYSVSPADVLTSRDAGLDRSTWPFVAMKTSTTPAALRAEGYAVADDVEGGEISGPLPSQALDTREANRDDLSRLSSDLKEVWKYEVWWPDYKAGDWHYCVRVGEVVLKYDKVPEHELVYWTPIIVSQRLDGLSIADLSFKLQDVSTAVHRALNNNFYQTSEPREEVVMDGVIEGATLDDMITGRLNGRVRVRHAGTIVPITSGGLPGFTKDMLDHYDERVSARTGIQRYQQGLAPDTLNKTATGTQLIMDAAAMRLEQVARTFAETGFRDRVGLIIRMSRREPERLQRHRIVVRGNTVPMSPELLVDDRDLLVNTGVGVGNRIERTTLLWRLLEQYSNLLANPQASRLCPGGDLAVFSAQNFHEALAEVLRLSGYTDTYHYTVAPLNQALPRDPPLPPPPPSPEEQYVQLEARKLDLDIQKALTENAKAAATWEVQAGKDEAATAEMYAKARSEAARADLDREKAEVERELGKLKLMVAEADVEAKEREADLKARELEFRERELELRERELALRGAEQTAKATNDGRDLDLKAADVALKYAVAAPGAVQGADGAPAAPTPGVSPREALARLSEALGGLVAGGPIQSEDGMQLQATLIAIQDALTQLTRPRQVIRDADGRVSGVGVVQEDGTVVPTVMVNPA